MKWHFCAVWRQEEKSKILVGRIMVNTAWIFTKILLSIDIDVFYLYMLEFHHDGLN